MYNDNLHKVSRVVAGKLYLYPSRHSYPIGHRLAFSGGFMTGDREIIVPFDKCIQVAKEVADIMRAV